MSHAVEKLVKYKKTTYFGFSNTPLGPNKYIPDKANKK